MDSAGANAKTLRACKDLNIDVITRLNDNLVKDDLNKLWSRQVRDENY